MRIYVDEVGYQARIAPDKAGLYTGAENVPTVDEAGLPGFESTTYYGFIAPAKTPRPVIEQLSRAFRAAAEDKEIQDRYAALGLVPKFMPPEEFDAFIKADVERVRALVKTIGAKVD